MLPLHRWEQVDKPRTIREEKTQKGINMLVAICENCGKYIELPEDGVLRHVIFCDNCRKFVAVSKMKVMEEQDGREIKKGYRRNKGTRI